VDHTKLKVLTYRWHVAHQAELWKLGFEVYLWQNPPYTMDWDYSNRPLPPNVKPITSADLAHIKFDLAILHFDENILTPHKTDRALSDHWGAPFDFLKSLSVPKVAICHGTPPLRGRFNPNYKEKVGYDEGDRKDMVDYVGDIPVVCNSHAAMKAWQFKNSRVIWHGVDPKDFPYADWRKNEILIVASNMSRRPWYQGYFMAKEAVGDLPTKLIGRDESAYFDTVTFPPTDGPLERFRAYVKELSSYLIMFNPTLYSPMPRSRLEAAMTGACIVTTNHQDEDMWIDNGVNGFYSNDPEELNATMQALLSDPAKAIEVGQRGRENCIERFHVNRYLDDWRHLIEEILG